MTDRINEFLEKYLISIKKPGRYIGGEFNQIQKKWMDKTVKIALAFPDIYDLGFSNLGLMILYDIINHRSDALAERAFAPWKDMEELMRFHKIPLYTLENKKPLREFDGIGFSIPYESLYTNVINMLNLAEIPIHSADRSDNAPIIFAGGHACFNPEPMSAFIDAFVIGEGEEVILEIIDCIKISKNRNTGKNALLDSLSKIDGIYIPSHFHIKYYKNGKIKSFSNIHDPKRNRIQKRIVKKLPPPPEKLLVPNIGVVHERFAIEIMRGCTRGCRFCQAGIITRPVRERSIDEILCAIQNAVDRTGFEEVSLLSLSSSDYSGINQLISRVQDLSKVKRFNLSLPSLRVETFSEEVISNMASKRKGNFTLAPESASESMRNAINKPILDSDLLSTTKNIINMGWKNIKLYFMIGFPDETMADVQSIADLCQQVFSLPRNLKLPPIKLHVSINTFIPKAHTPFQWAKMADREDINKKYALLRNELGKTRIKLDWPSYDNAFFESVFSRGDRKLSAVIEEAWKMGAKFDAWNECFDFKIWDKAFNQVKVDKEFYIKRERLANEIFPWDHINSGVKKEFLYSEYQKSKSGDLTFDCRQHCHACGIQACYGLSCNNLRLAQ